MSLTVANKDTVNHIPILTCPIPASPVAPLSQSQLDLVSNLSAQLPNLITSVVGDVTEDDKCSLTEWADTACVTRYLRATKWDLQEAVDRLQSTLQWRFEYKPDRIDSSLVKDIGRSGRSYISGFTKERQPILFLVPRMPHTEGSTHELQLKFSVFFLEQAIKRMPEGVEKIALLIDYRGVTRANSTPLSVSLKYLSIFANHYPERLGLGMLYDPSWFFPVFLAMIGPFMDPVTRAKIQIVHSKNKDILRFVDADQLPVEYGGSFEFEFSHPVYWQYLLNQNEK
ncbi:hypothetical protein HDU84_009052 [Entophlyctis sp. JEL0112]|nr:hypothetical protein HDU84_009052 [Entophlyctis sp. JEL0112]